MMSIVWWNIFGFKHNPQILEKHLLDLSQRNQILVLGEFNPNTAPKGFIEKMKKNLPHYSFSSGADTSYGIAIFSKEKIKEVNKIPSKVDNSFLLSFKIKDKKFLATHFRHDWYTMSKDKEMLFPKLKILLGNIFDIGSSINIQVNELDNYLKNHSPDVLLGDFNTFPSFIGIKSHLYSSLKKRNYEGLIHSTTWPNPNVEFSKGFPELVLDQMFVKDKKKIKSGRLYIDGSDHFPIYVTLPN